MINKINMVYLELSRVTLCLFRLLGYQLVGSRETLCLLRFYPMWVKGIMLLCFSYLEKHHAFLFSHDFIVAKSQNFSVTLFSNG